MSHSRNALPLITLLLLSLPWLPARAAASSSDGGDWLIMLMAWSVPGYFILQIWIWRRWHDNWRRAGLLPLWASIPISGYTLFAMLMGSNLWPLVMLFAMPVLFGYLAVVSAMRLLRD